MRFKISRAGLVPIDAPVFFLEDRRVGRLRVVLRFRMNMIELGHRSPREIRAGLREPRTEFRSGFFGPISVSHFSSMSPVSSPSLIFIVVTPVRVSPRAMAH